MKGTSGYTFLMALLLGAAAFFLTRAVQTEKSSQSFAEQVAAQEQDTSANLAWMRKQLSLTDQEFAKECELHEAHMVEYRRLCAGMNEARERLRLAIQKDTSLNAEEQAAIRNYEIQVEACELEAVKHVKKAAAAMNPEAGARYLNIMLPKLFPNHDTVAHTNVSPRISH